jgi:hypothetical protein
VDHRGTILTVSRDTAHHRSHWSALANTSSLFVIFGEHQVMAQLIAKRVLIAPLIHKDFPVRHSLLARGNVASVNLNHQK